jgi:hypothetical protein
MNNIQDNNLLDRIQKFNARLNAEPVDGIESTPDNRARTITISHIEMTLDELYFGQWSVENFHWSTIANEVQGSLELVVIHPITGNTIRRTGAGSIVIMVDKVPDEIKSDMVLRNRWALSPDNKKSNALDMAFPKLKAECLKNAAQSLGKIFGRDLNRKNADVYKPFKLNPQNTGLLGVPMSVVDKMIAGIESGEPKEEIVNAIGLLSELLSVEQKEMLNTKMTEHYGNK